MTELDPAMTEKIHRAADFAVPFAHAMSLLLKAVTKGEGVTFSADEARATLDCIRMLKDGAKS